VLPSTIRIKIVYGADDASGPVLVVNELKAVVGVDGQAPDPAG
jgi:hypothetical protein